MFDLNKIDKTWTLFIDRDGVFNHEKKEDYILNWGEFSFYEGVLDTVEILNKRFGTIVMVTNQKGVGKGLMTVDDLNHIHQNMMEAIVSHKGRIDKIYYAPDLASDAPNRKPNAGMALQAKNDFPHINFSKSIMVGNKLSDMGFGRNAGAYTVFLATTNPETLFPHPDIDARFANLPAFAAALIKA
ncbi:D-glycero-alpha-D-manno-heptose-1,7-bisphosphate 7-phosphatase [Parasediminibacterium sp. JCM 36343]|uniref:D-glycero-alpha-D-manno-heptose-1,7-bisphosphate 7-phosphatase n=1 Tax=Parasediminibacterium sp. JCM 36343 TaxID=3374279 RepID=UPI00397C18BA